MKASISEHHNELLGELAREIFATEEEGFRSSWPHVCIVDTTEEFIVLLGDTSALYDKDMR